MTGPKSITVPAALAASHTKYFGEHGRRWIADLPGLVAECLERWELRPDGEPSSGAVALVVPVVRADGTLAALKVQPVDDETRGEAMALRRWAGLGAVHLLEHDGRSGSMLLERLDPDCSLASVPDDLAALEVIADLLQRLNAVRAPADLRHLGAMAAAMLVRLPAALEFAADPVERQLLSRCAAMLQELLTEPVANCLLHWDLHYDNVLAREPFDPADPWRAIDPKPLSGDPAFELLPALWNRWDDVVATGDVTRAVLRRVDLLVDVLGLEWRRAQIWTLARVLQNAVWDLGQYGQTTIEPSHRAIAEALLSRPPG